MRHTTTLLAATAALLLAIPALAADQPQFPRLAGVNMGGPHNYDDAAYQAKLAKLNFSVINTWVGLDKTYGMTMEQVVRNIKAINPESEVFLYENSMEVEDGNAAMAPVFDKVAQMKWWAFPRGGDGPAPALALRRAHEEVRLSRQQHAEHAARQQRLPAVGMARTLGGAAAL